jgi:Flp pilus assembly protein TadD
MRKYVPESPSHIRTPRIRSQESIAMAHEFYVQASALMESGHRSEALICLQKARILAPCCPEILHALGNCLSDMGRPDAACTCYREALEGIGNRLMAIGNYEVSAGHYAGRRAR